MKKPDDFEQQAQKHAFRQCPVAWRGEILSAVREVRPEMSQTRAGVLPGGNQSEFLVWLRLWMWPSPAAWGGLAAIWLVLVALGNTPPGGTKAAAGDRSDSGTQIAVGWQERTRFLSELIPDQPRELTPSSLSPRSQHPSQDHPA